MPSWPPGSGLLQEMKVLVVRPAWLYSTERGKQSAVGSGRYGQLSKSLTTMEKDLSFLDFGGPKRPDTALDFAESRINKDAHPLTLDGHSGNLEHETGFEPATPTLATSCSTS